MRGASPVLAWGLVMMGLLVLSNLLALESFSILGTVLLAGLLLPTVGLVPAGLVLSLRSLWKGRREAALVWLGTAVISCLSWCSSVATSRNLADGNKKLGDEIAAALASCRSATGHYPASLDALVPAYLPSIPPTRMGLLREVPYGYWPDERGGYTLRYPAPAWVLCERGEEPGWRCHD